MSYYHKKIKCEALDLIDVLSWIKNNYPDAEGLDHTTFEDSNEPWHYYMVTFLGTEDLGTESVIAKGCEEWKEWNGIYYNTDWHCTVIKYNDVYWYATH